MLLERRSIIVTGGTRGIGLATARALLDRGAQVTIGARSEGSIAEGRAALGGGADLAAVVSDVRTVAGCQGVARAAVDAFGQIDGLVTNAGVYGETDIADATEDAWNLIIDTNLKSTFFCIQAALPALRASHGAIVTMASYNGVDGIAGNVGAYGAAKAGVINLTKALALDLAPDVRVNSVAPGFVETEKLRAIPNATAVIDQLAAITPRGRIGSVEDVAHAVVFALENEFLTGATIMLDGGRSAGR